MTLYDRIASIYDPWSRSVTEDVEFYVEQALAAGGPVVELAVGTGRIAIPIAVAGIDVIGVDSSPAMLEVAHAAADEASVSERVDLRLGDLRDPPVPERVPLVICPFRSLLHMETEDEKLRALRAARNLLESGGSFVFDVFAPSREDIEETDGRWIEREPGIFERANWDEAARTTGQRRPSGCTGFLPLNGSGSWTRRSSRSRRSTGGSIGGRTTATRTCSSSRGDAR